MFHATNLRYIALNTGLQVSQLKLKAESLIAGGFNHGLQLRI